MARAEPYYKDVNAVKYGIGDDYRGAITGTRNRQAGEQLSSN